MRTPKVFLVSLVALVLLAAGGCGQAEPEKRYQLRGEIVKLDPATQVATIQHEKIGDWMDAMTMEFPVKPKPEFDKLSPGDQVTGAVVVRGMDYHVTDIKVVAKKTETPQ
jgi:protein SCO1/2